MGHEDESSADVERGIKRQSTSGIETEFVFRRSGKWTIEEEAFAKRLMDEFDAGSLCDVPNGCTKRSFLAHKLRCAPMRISKKFAGQCAGKVYDFVTVLHFPLF